MSSPFTTPPTLNIGLVGFGAFGRLIAKHLAPYARLCIFDPALLPSDCSDTDGIRVTSLAEAARCPVVVLAVPVNRMEESVQTIGQYLQPGSLVLDVGSVKLVPAEFMRRGLPPHIDIVATHPLFGPQSARDGIKGLKIAVCPIRGARGRRVGAFLRTLGLHVIMTTPDAHDREAAMVQGLTHLIAKVLVQMEPLPTLMTTRSFDLLIQGVNMVRDDAPEVFQAIERTNPYSQQVRRRFFDLAAKLDAELSQEPF